MDLKKLGKRALSVFLALVMAVPMVAFAPPVVAEAYEQAIEFVDIADFNADEFIPVAPTAEFTGFATGRDTITVNGLTAEVTAWNPTADVVDGVPARSMRVSLSGTPVGLGVAARYIVYARAGTGPNVVPVRSGESAGNAHWQPRDAGAITNFSTSTSGEITLTFPASGGGGTGAQVTNQQVIPAWTFANNNVRLYIGVVTRSGSAALQAGGAIAAGGAGGFTGGGTQAAVPPVGVNSTRENIFTFNGVQFDTTHRIYTAIASGLYSRLSGEVLLSGRMRIWYTGDTTAWGGSNQTISAIGSPGLGGATVNSGPWGQSPPIEELNFNTDDVANQTVGWTQNVLRPHYTVIRVEYEPFPALGGVIDTHNGITPSASGAIATGQPIFQVNVPLAGTAQVGANHRITIGNIPPEFNIGGVTGSVEQVFRVEEDDDLATILRFNVRATGQTTPLTEAQATTLVEGLTVAHAYFPDRTFELGTDVDGVTATGVARVDALSQMLTVDVTLGGNATAAGDFAVNLTGAGLPSALTDVRMIPITTGPVTASQRWVAFGFTDLAIPTMGINLVRHAGADIRNFTSTPTNGLTATGSVTLMPGIDTPLAVIGVSGIVTSAGFYTVVLTGSGFTYTPASPERFAFNQNVSAGTSFQITVYDRDNFEIGVRIDFASADNFFYVINYRDMSISIGETFAANVFVTMPNGRVAVEDDGVTPMLLRHPEGHPLEGEPVLIASGRENITWMFNRRADRFNPSRGNWSRTFTGEIEVHRQVRRGGYIGVRRQLTSGPNAGQFELIGIIELPAAPANRYIRAHRRDIFVPRIVGVAGEYNFFQNPEPVGTNTDGVYVGRGEDIEVRIGADRGFVSNLILPLERLSPGQTWEVDHDALPRGSRGAYRIAPTETTNFVNVGGTWFGIRDLIRTNGTIGTPGVPQLTLAEIEAMVLPGTDYDSLEDMMGEGNFGSAHVRFRIPNQPNAPATPRMAVTPGRNGAANFVSRTNANMSVWAWNFCEDEDEYVRAWRQLRPNITVTDFIGLFEGQEMPLDDTGTTYVFEIRVLRAGRIMSAPGFLPMNAAAFNAATGVTAAMDTVIVAGTQNDPRTNAQNPVNRANGVNVTVRTSGGVVNAGMVGQDVASWFYTGGPDDATATPTGLPAGLSATITRISGGAVTIRVQGMATAPAVNTPIWIRIPGTAIQGGQEVRATNPALTGNAAREHRAIFNIAAAEVTVTPELQSATSPADPFAVTFENAYAGDWGLPATVAVVTSPAGITTANVTWTVAGFDNTADAAQPGLIATGVLSAIAPATFTNPLNVTVTATVNVAAPVVDPGLGYVPVDDVPEAPPVAEPDETPVEEPDEDVVAEPDEDVVFEPVE